MIKRLLMLGTMVLLTVAAAAALAQDIRNEAHDYLPVIEQELARLDLSARCDAAARTCIFTHAIAGDKEVSLDVVIRYNPETDTVYIYVDRLVSIGQEEGPSDALAKRLLALNSELVTAKFEWDQPGGAIRLSTVLSTDSNFDRRAFRSQLKGLLKVADQLYPELTMSQAGPTAKVP